MSADPSWDRLEELFEKAAAVPPEARSAWMDQHCHDDPKLRAQLESLLAAVPGAEGFVRGLSDRLVGGGARGFVTDSAAAGSESSGTADSSLVRELLAGSTADSAQLARLTAGLGDRYGIEGEIGTGGMATVYLARDLKHGRKVALKVVKPELAALLGTERFLKEIEVTAKLQHPHILPLFDSGSLDSLPYYVMPFIEGESLAQRLERESQLPIEEALSIAVTVGKALQYAHELDVVHRDIKPANILLHRGQPLVTDFGIALAVTAAGGRKLTETGLSVGTPEYMSPEQASGKGSVDARTDQYALACVLYEMLAGEPPHTGPTVPAIIAKVLTDRPRRLRASRETVPPHVEMATHRALSKIAPDRYPTVARFIEALENPAVSREWPGLVQLEGVSWRKAGVWAALVLLAFAAILGWIRGPPGAPGPTTRFDFSYPTGEFYSSLRHALAISPNGSTIAYVGQGERAEQLYLRRVDQLESRVMPGTEGALDPFFSPDGESVGFATLVGLMRLPVTGGAPVKIAEFPEVRGPNWGRDGIILFGSTSGLWQVPASGGQPHAVTKLDSARNELMHSRPQRLPGSDAVLFTITAGGLDETQVAVLSPRSGEIRRLFPGIAPRYSTTGHIIYGRSDGMLMAVPFDARRLRITGPADTLLSGVAVKQTGSMDFAISANGSLVYLTGGVVPGRLALVDRTGAQEFLTGPDMLGTPSFSPDGRRIIVGRGMPPTRQIWMLEVADRTLGPVTFEGHNYYPVFSPDGSRFVFTTEQATGSADLRWKPADGSGEARLMVRADSGVLYYPESWSPDGTYLVARRQETRNGQTDRDLWVVHVEGHDPPRPLLDLPSSREDAARLSPDGKWLAFSSDLTGEYEIYVIRFPNPGRRIPISRGGGTEPAWSPSGREIFYRNGDDMMVATVDTADELAVIDRQVLFTGRYLKWHYHTNYDVHPDGQRFVLVARWGAGTAQRAVVVVNWFEELRRLVRRGS